MILVANPDTEYALGDGTKEKGRAGVNQLGLENNPGSDLLSHAVTHAVPSAVAGLTSVFGMGTGGTLPL